MPALSFVIRRAYLAGNGVAMALQDIRDRLQAAERAAGRAEGSVTLIAVSKVQPEDRVLAVLAQGHRVFGENYAGSCRQGPPWRGRFPGVELHMIGPLQTNKAKVAVDLLLDAIHTLDRPRWRRSWPALARRVIAA